MVLIKQYIKDHHDQKSQQVVHKCSKNTHRFIIVLLQNLVSDIPGQSGHMWKRALGDPLFTNNMMQNA